MFTIHNDVFTFSVSVICVKSNPQIPRFICQILCGTNGMKLSKQTGEGSYEHHVANTFKPEREPPACGKQTRKYFSMTSRLLL